MIVALLATGVQTFSCSFMKNPDTLIERVIKKVQAEKKSDEIFCDSDDLKMLYYLIQGEDYNLNLGVSINIDETTTNNQFKNRFYQKLEEYKKFNHDRPPLRRMFERTGYFPSPSTKQMTENYIIGMNLVDKKIDNGMRNLYYTYEQDFRKDKK